MDFTLNRTDRQSDQIRIILKTLLQPRVVTGISRQTIAAGNLKGTRQTDDDFAIALTVQFNLARLVTHQLRLVAAFDRAQLFSSAARKENAGDAQRQQAYEQQYSQHDVQESDLVNAL